MLGIHGSSGVPEVRLMAGTSTVMFWAGIMAAPLIVIETPGPARLVTGKLTLMVARRKRAT